MLTGYNLSKDTLSLFISMVSLGVSATMAWYKLFKRGTLKMTRPTYITFDPNRLGDPSYAGISFKALLISTSERGQIIESLYVTLSRNGTVQPFKTWSYQEGDNISAKWGAGLFIGQNGLTTEQYFLLPRDNTQYTFVAGEYALVVYAKLIDRSKSIKIFSENLTVSHQNADLLSDKNNPRYDVNNRLTFYWDVDTFKYNDRLENYAALLKDRNRLINLIKNPESIADSKL